MEMDENEMEMGEEGEMEMGENEMEMEDDDEVEIVMMFLKAEPARFLYRWR